MTCIWWVLRGLRRVAVCWRSSLLALVFIRSLGGEGELDLQVFFCFSAGQFLIYFKQLLSSQNRRTMTLGAVSAVFCSSASCGVKTWTGSGSTFLPRRALKMAVKWKSVNPRAWAIWDSPNSVIMKAVILATLVGACVYRNQRRGSAMTLDGSAVSQPSPFHLQLLHGRSYRWRSCGFVVNFIHFYDWWKWLLVTDLN